MIALATSRLRRRQPKKKAAAIVRRQTLIAPATAAENLIESACIGLAELLSEYTEGVIFIQGDDNICWRVTLEVDRSGGVA